MYVPGCSKPHLMNDRVPHLISRQAEEEGRQEGRKEGQVVQAGGQGGGRVVGRQAGMRACRQTRWARRHDEGGLGGMMKRHDEGGGAVRQTDRQAGARGEQAGEGMHTSMQADKVGKEAFTHACRRAEGGGEPVVLTEQDGSWMLVMPPACSNHQIQLYKQIGYWSRTVWNPPDPAVQRGWQSPQGRVRLPSGRVAGLPRCPSAPRLP